ncbi:hypothetical protein ACFVXB_28665, partial [Streptomyces sp. NPDC058247]
MTGRHPPLGRIRTSALPALPSRRTVLRTVAAGTFATAAGARVSGCGPAGGRPPRTVGVDGVHPTRGAPQEA